MDDEREAMRAQRRPVTLIVRVWRRPEGFRADVRTLHSGPGEARFFHSLGALLDHLAALDAGDLDDPRDPDDPDGSGTP